MDNRPRDISDYFWISAMATMGALSGITFFAIGVFIFSNIWN